MTRGQPPLVAGGQGRSPRDVVFGARVVLACVLGIVAVWIARELVAL